MKEHNITISDRKNDTTPLSLASLVYAIQQLYLLGSTCFDPLGSRSFDPLGLKTNRRTDMF